MKNQELIATFIAIFIAIILFLAGIIFSFDPYTEDAPVLTPQPTSFLDSSCADVSGDAYTACCQAWVDENELMLPACIGEWQKTEAGVCSWICTTE